MAGALVNLLRLGRAGLVLAQHGVRFVPKGMAVPPLLALAGALTAPIGWITAPFRIGEPKDKRISNALAALGPSYIKLGQFLATRGDLIGPELARDLGHLQDKLPPFPMAEARKAVAQELGGRLEDHFVGFGPPVAAASIAQVHKAEVLGKNGARRPVAVKILRPNIEKRFRRDLDSYYFAARQIERFHPPSRRLRPVAVVENLQRTTELEMDLRLEAAAISEMAENIAPAERFRVPKVDWLRTSKRVLTLEWIDGIPISDHAALEAAGHDRRALGMVILRSFLTHAMRDGFFHADMHQGNLFVDEAGNVVAVDFGIMGRLGPKERRFLATILHGLITRDYRRAAEVHFWAGYVPPHHPVEVFAQALRAIGEPIHGRTAEEISMADLLGQLFAYTEVFDMQTRPELILLQKSMVIVEGVARELDPNLNLWQAAEPVAKEWMERNLGLGGRLREAGEGASTMAGVLAGLPEVLAEAERAAGAFAGMAGSGVRLDAETVRALARERARAGRWRTLGLWLIALALLGILGVQLGFTWR
jgi:ubiquinone biosynthesis protein